jgi:hypothetical protein
MSCAIVTIALILMAMSLFQQSNEVDSLRWMFLTEESLNHGIIETQLPALAATTTALSATIAYLQVKQDNLAATLKAH